MKKSYVLSLLLAGLTLSCGPNTQEITTQVNLFIDQQKYQSAYDLLEKTDPQNQYTDLVLQKVKTALRYGFYNPGSKTYNFKNLLKGQSFEDFRWAKREGPAYTLQPEVVLNMQIQKHPEDWRLYQALGQYYFWMTQNMDGYNPTAFGGYLKLATDKYTMAFNHQALDGDGLYGFGLVHYQEGEYIEAVTFFSQALEKGNKSADAYFMLANDQSALSQYVQSNENARKAFDLYTDLHKKETAAILISCNYEQLNDFDSSEKYLLSVNENFPQSTNIPNALLRIAFEKKDFKKAEVLTRKMFIQNPDDVTSLISITNLYNANKKTKLFSEILNKMKRENSKNNNVLIGLYFCEGLSKALDKKNKAAKAAFVKAENLAEKLNPPNDSFLQYLRSVIQYSQTPRLD